MDINHSWHKDEVLENIKSRLYNNLSKEPSNIFYFIDLILEENIISLSPEELFDLILSLQKITVSEFLLDLAYFKEEILQKLIDLSIIGLKGELKAVNIEINKDVKEVKRIIKYIVFDEKYNEFLKIDFPRVLYPKDTENFNNLIKIGKELRELHLMESKKIEKMILYIQYQEQEKL